MAYTPTIGTPPAITSFNSLASINTTATAAASSAAYTTDTTKATVDAQVQIKIALPAGFTPSGATLINVYAYGSADGTTWPGGSATAEVLTGADSAITLSTLGTNLVWVGSILAHTAGITITSEPLSIRSAFGYLPKKWALVITNALPATYSLAASGHSVVVTEISY